MVMKKTMECFDNVEGVRVLYYLFSQNFACLVTNAALCAHWSCVKRCTEDGKCQKYLFKKSCACLVTNAVFCTHW